MKKLALILFAAIALNALAAESAVKGFLVDASCNAEEGQEPNFGARHTKSCLKMDECIRSGYGVFTADKKFIKFTKEGDEQVKKFIGTLSKDSDIRVTVTGEVSGDRMTVSKIELQ
ncbi:MAG TPA: hypothetical protein VKZ53_11085 [Candidatus Angelobacter sp.]|nr:hypothetical protein [Candidatus Angelobacter sp.]